MPFLPTFNDLKNVSISINPLNLFSDSPNPAASKGVGEPGPGPSSLAARGARPALRSESSSSDSFDGDVEGRRKSCLMIHEEERPVRLRKKKVPMDTYIIVKPPPTASKNPLNLQIQLVVGKSGRPRSDSTATRATSRGSRSPSVFSDNPNAPILSAPAPGKPTPGGSTIRGTLPGQEDIEGLERRRSESPASTQISNEDAAALPPPLSADSTASAGTITSGLRRITSRKSSSGSIPFSTTSASGQKRIQPMFNLNVHNVMHSTVVTDAGTDAKVAKFGKRTIEIVDVGILEPSEIWQVANNSSTLFPPGSTLEETRSRPMSMYSLTAPISPVATRIAEENGRGRNSLDLKGLRPEILQEGGASAKRFFGKIGGAFKKKAAGGEKEVNLGSPILVPSNATNGGSGSTIRGHSKDVAVNGTDVAVGPPTFGCSPSVVARRGSNSRMSTTDGLAPPDSASLLGANRSCTPSNRPVGYVWTVKKWAKRNTDGWAGTLAAALADGVKMEGAICGEGDDEVVFEWAKARGTSSFAPNGSRSRRSSIASRGHSRPPSSMGPSDSPPDPRPLPSPSPGTAPGTPTLDARPKPVRRVSTASSLSPRKQDSTLPDDSSGLYHTAEEDDSDPEDSETPWQCCLIVKKTGERQVLGTIIPAPHHPKVVGQLRLPSKLETPCLAELKGGADEEVLDRVKRELCLSEESVKDVVCVTALWLVAREGWNGLGKVKRGR